MFGISGPLSKGGGFFHGVNTPFPEYKNRVTLPAKSGLRELGRYEVPRFENNRSAHAFV